MLLHETTDFLCMSPTDDNMMVADGVLEQIRFQVHIERDLCAAEMVAVRCFDGLCFDDEITV